ncbi:hypothetical protein, partial [Staphylococcus aureus]
DTDVLCEDDVLALIDIDVDIDVLKEPDALVVVDWLCDSESLNDVDGLVELEALTLVEPGIESLKLVDGETDT